MSNTNCIRLIFFVIFVLVLTACGGAGGGGDSGGGGATVEYQDENGDTIRISNVININPDTAYADSYVVGSAMYYTFTPSHAGFYEFSISDVVPVGNDGRGHYLDIYRDGGGFVEGGLTCSETSACTLLLKEDEKYVIRLDQYLVGFDLTDDFTNTTYSLRVEDTGTDATDVVEREHTVGDFSEGNETYYRFTASETGTYQIGFSRIKPSYLDTSISWDLHISSGERIERCNSPEEHIGCFFELTEGVEYVVRGSISNISPITGYTFSVLNPFNDQGSLEAPIALQEVMRTTSEISTGGFSYYSFTPPITTTYEVITDGTNNTDPEEPLVADFGYTDTYIGDVYLDDDNLTLYNTCASERCTLALEAGVNYIFQVGEYDNYEADSNSAIFGGANTGYNGGQFDMSVGIVASEGSDVEPITISLDQPHDGFVGNHFSFASSWYSYTPTVSGSYTFSLTNYSNPSISLGFLIEDNTTSFFDPISDCLANNDVVIPEAFCTVDLVAGTEYLIEIDNPRWHDFGSRYTISVSMN